MDNEKKLMKLNLSEEEKNKLQARSQNGALSDDQLDDAIGGASNLSNTPACLGEFNLRCLNCTCLHELILNDPKFPSGLWKLVKCTVPKFKEQYIIDICNFTYTQY